MSREPAAKPYETIAARMHTSGATTRSWGFTSATGGEGTSSTALGTAVALTSLQAEPVLLIDANWMTPTLSRDAHAAGGIDLDACLRSKARLADAIIAMRAPTLFLLPSSETTAESPSGALPVLVAEATAAFRYVLVDLPPILRATALVMSWAAVLGQVIVLVDRDVTRARTLKRALREVAPIREPSLVLNR